jgi:tRNA pseudouridine38-40 synthase
MRRIRIILAYEGTHFHGWQVQPGLPTIQGTLQQVLAQIEGRPVHVVGSGRTDAGVHALAQVAAFDFENRIPTENLRRAMNRLLPPSIRVLEAQEAPPDFDPRRQALWKTYEYRIWRTEICPPFERRYVHHFPYPLEEERLIAAAPLLEGEHDFTAFAAPDESDRPGERRVRRIFSSRAERRQEKLIYRVTGSGFLKHMVRNIVGTLLEVGKGNLDEAGLRALLKGGRPGSAGPTAPASGLFLTEVRYW